MRSEGRAFVYALEGQRAYTRDVQRLRGYGDRMMGYAVVLVLGFWMGFMFAAILQANRE